MKRRPITRTAGLALLLATLWSSAPAHAQTRHGAARLIGPGRLALPASAFGPGAIITEQNIDWSARAVTQEDILAPFGQGQQGQLYASLHAVGSLYERVDLPATVATGQDGRSIDYMATSFGTAGAARAAWNGDTAFIDSFWADEEKDKPRLAAAPGRYRTRAGILHIFPKSTAGMSDILVVGVVGNVEFTMDADALVASPQALQQVIADASTVARHAFSAYKRLPVTPGPVPATPAIPATQDSGSGAAIIVVMVVTALLCLVASWRIYTKAGAPGWTALVPIVSTLYLLKIVGRPLWWFFLFLIPFAGVVFWIVALHDLSRSFGHRGWFTTGLLFLPFIFWPVLAFSGTRYIGPAAAPRPYIANTSTRTGETNDDLPTLPVWPVFAMLVGVVVLGLLVFCLNLL